MKTKNILITIACVLVVVLTLGLTATLFLPDDVMPAPPEKEVEVAAVAYHPGYGEEFKGDYPISMLTLTDEMNVAPYADSDTTLFSG